MINLSCFILIKIPWSNQSKLNFFTEISTQQNVAQKRPFAWSVQMKKSYLFISLLLIIVFNFLAPLPLHAEGQIELSKGQTIYVPAYSHIYSGNREKPFLLAVTVSIRNIDPKNPISITSINYYETQGKLLKIYLEKPAVLAPLGSLRYIVPEGDKTGGSGANFIVEWRSDKPVNPPIVESVMIGTQSQQGISFTSRGQVIQ